MISKLVKLSDTLKLFGHQKISLKLAQIIDKLPEFPEGEISDFAWLRYGVIFRKMGKMQFDDFVDLNSSILSQFDVRKYLSSGQVGDVWLLDDEKVLKIYDANAETGFASDLKKYEKIENSLYDESYSLSAPMIYESGIFEIPDSFKYIIPTSKFNKGKPFRPAYVIMETVQTYNEIVQAYLDNNKERIKEQGYSPVSLLDLEELGIQEVNSDNKDKYTEKIGVYLKHICDRLIEFVSVEFGRAMNDFNVNFGQDDEDEELVWEGTNLVGTKKVKRNPNNDPLDIRRKDVRNKMADEYAEEFNEMGEIPFGSFNSISDMLGIPDWHKQIARATVDARYRGLQDLHFGNFGFKNGRVVFYDG